MKRHIHPFYRSMMMHAALSATKDRNPDVLDRAVKYASLSRRDKPASIVSDEFSVRIMWGDAATREILTFRPAAQTLEHFEYGVKTWEVTI